MPTKCVDAGLRVGGRLLPDGMGEV